MAEATKRKIKNLDDILADLSELSDKGEGAQQTQAYRLLMSHQAASNPITLPVPMDYADQMVRLVRLMKFVGRDFCIKAMAHAFRQKRDRVIVADDDMEWSKYKFPSSLKHFYRLFPFMKQSGFPKGYPRGKSLVEKKEWVIEQTKHIYRERKQKDLDQSQKETQAGIKVEKNPVLAPASESAAFEVPSKTEGIIKSWQETRDE